MERYWLNIILSNNIDIDYENIYNQYKNLRSISSYISNYKIDFKKKFKNDNEDVNVNVNKNEDVNKNINLNKNMNKNEHVCDCDLNDICITADFNKFKKCNNYNNFINNNPILELLFVKKKIDFCYIPNTNILEGEYKNEIISNVRNHMDFINIIHCEKKIVFIISMFN
jgi:hypothetical protein